MWNFISKTSQNRLRFSLSQSDLCMIIYILRNSVSQGSRGVKLWSIGQAASHLDMRIVGQIYFVRIKQASVVVERCSWVADQTKMAASVSVHISMEFYMHDEKYNVCIYFYWHIYAISMFTHLSTKPEISKDLPRE